MGGLRALPAIAGALLLIAANAAKADDRETAADEGVWVYPEVSGAPLPTWKLGNKGAERKKLDPDKELGLGDTRVGPPGGLGSPWPGPNLIANGDFGQAYSFPTLSSGVGAEVYSYVGRKAGGEGGVSVQRVRANFLLVEAAINTYTAIDRERLPERDLELDLRIPFALGKGHRVALMQGVTVPIDKREKNASTTNVRAQMLVGLAWGSVGVQARAGYIEGSRRKGLLLVDETVERGAMLYGTLLTWRPVSVMELRMEGSGEMYMDEGWGRLSLLPGVALFPFGDPRLSIGAAAIFEDSAKAMSQHVKNWDLRASQAWGGMLQLGLNLY